MAFIPEDRHRQGLVLPMKVWENNILGLHRNAKFRNNLFVDTKKVEEFTLNNVEEFSIMLSSIYQATESLSGGNQQKSF